MSVKSTHIISWNVNGIRSVLGKDSLTPVLDINADMLCLQETKAHSDVIPELDLMHYPYRYFHNAEKRGYSGTAILSHVEPINITHDMPSPVNEHPLEGRVLTAEFEKFFLVNVYVPNSKRGLLRLPYRQNEWDVDFRKYLVSLAKKKSIIVVGDLNVAHEEIDVANPKSNRRNAGFTDEERKNFMELLESGFIDTFREMRLDEADRYSWWSYMSGARANNIGWRIDYCLVSEDLGAQVVGADIYDQVMGSDHAPVSVKVEGLF